MKKQVLLLALGLMCCMSRSGAQSRVFKAVSEEMSSEVKAIMQEDLLMGYVVFSKLEKINADSFSYKLSIMDENLNDIGTYSFSDGDMTLQQVAFESDVLCLAYLKNTYKKPAANVKRSKVLHKKSNVMIINGKTEDKENYYKYVTTNIKSFIHSQFLNLDGKLIGTANAPVELIHSEYAAYFANQFNGSLKNSLQITTLPGKGFAYVYGDGAWENVNQNKGSDEHLLAYDLQGTQLFKRRLPATVSYGLDLMADDSYLHVLRKSDSKDGPGFELLSYNLSDSTYYAMHKLKDKNNNRYNVLGFKKHVGNGKPYISGVIVKDGHELGSSQNKEMRRGQYAGVFNINLDKADFKEQCSYWSGGSKKGVISRKGYVKEAACYPYINYTYDDYEGNVYYTGSGVKPHTRWGIIGATVATAPLILPAPFILAMGGTTKYNSDRVLTLKQSKDGQLSYHSVQPSNRNNFLSRKARLFLSDKSFFAVHNEDSRATYLVFSDIKDIVIYDVNTKKAVRTIPHSEGKTNTNVFKAKAGHIMVSEYNARERATKLSIEAL